MVIALLVVPLTHLFVRATYFTWIKLCFFVRFELTKTKLKTRSRIEF